MMLVRVTVEQSKINNDRWLKRGLVSLGRSFCELKLFMPDQFDLLFVRYALHKVRPLLPTAVLFWLLSTVPILNYNWGPIICMKVAGCGNPGDRGNSEDRSL